MRLFAERALLESGWAEGVLLAIGGDGLIHDQTTGVRRPGMNLYVYERAGKPCRRCGTGILKSLVGSRTTFWCPRCQPG